MSSAFRGYGVQIPSELSSIKVNFVLCLSKVIIHPEAAGFFGGRLIFIHTLFSCKSVFAVISLFQGITWIKAFHVFHYSPDNMKHFSNTGNKRQFFAFATFL